MLSDMLLYLVCKDLLAFDLMKIVSWKLPHYYGTLSFFILAFHTIIHELMLIDGDMYKFCNVTEKQFAFDGNRQVARSISFSKKFMRPEIICHRSQFTFVLHCAEWRICFYVWFRDVCRLSFFTMQLDQVWLWRKLLFGSRNCYWMLLLKFLSNLQLMMRWSKIWTKW